jgi:hypothetical protein
MEHRNPFDDDYEVLSFEDEGDSATREGDGGGAAGKKESGATGVTTDAATVSEEARVGRYLVEKNLLQTALKFYQECPNGQELDFLRQRFEAKASGSEAEAHNDTTVPLSRFLIHLSLSFI